jgi:hypothetical protein
LKEKVAAPVYKAENTAVGIRHADHVAPLYPQKLALTSPTSGGRSVGIVRSRTEATEFSLVIELNGMMGIQENLEEHFNMQPQKTTKRGTPAVKMDGTCQSWP